MTAPKEICAGRLSRLSVRSVSLQNRRLDPGEIDDRQVTVGLDQVATAIAGVVASGEVADDAHVEPRDWPGRRGESRR